jgi:diaminopimelate decarboxylase
MIIEITKNFGTPVWVYDAAIIRQRIADLRSFDVIRYAQKANSNTHILRLMRAEGVKVDAVSVGEVERALFAGYQKDEIVYTADLMDRSALAFIIHQNITVNAGSIDMLTQLGEQNSGHKVWIRINPGFGHGHSPKTNTGGENSKHGIWHGDVQLALTEIRKYGLELVGVHMHIGSGVDYGHLEMVCDSMISLIKKEGIDVGAISAGGGLSVPYQAGEEPINPTHYFEIWDKARKNLENHLGHAVKLEIEPGRYLVAESGQLITEVRAVKEMGSRHYVMVDAGFTELVRPAMYGSYHEMTVIGKEGARETIPTVVPTVVAGPLCESGDVFTQEDGGVVVTRELPKVEIGDYIVIGNAGAYGASMSSNYNSRPYCPEVMIDGHEVKLIRRRQEMSELLELEQV